MAKASKQIQKSTKVLKSVLEEYKIEDLDYANTMYVCTRKGTGQSDNNDDFEKIKQMYSNYKKLKYNQQKKQ